MDLSQKLRLYAAMLRIRMVEEKLIELWQQGLMRSLMHLSTGQEAIAAGICANLNQNDEIVLTHRCHAGYLAKGGSLEKMFAEIAGKVDGCSRGRGGSMHLFDLQAGVRLSLPIVAGSIPIAVGVAHAIKLKRDNRIVVAFFGDGAVEEGVFWESINFAVVHQLPILFVCENNLYATHSHILKRQFSPDIVDRVETQGLCCASVDGNNAVEVFSLSQKMISAVRFGPCPAFIEAKTYRWKEHWGPGEDWHMGYRSKEEGDHWKQLCPIKRLEEELISEEVLGLGGIKADIEAEIARACEFASSSNRPEEGELSQWEVTR